MTIGSTTQVGITAGSSTSSGTTPWGAAVGGLSRRALAARQAEYHQLESRVRDLVTSARVTPPSVAVTRSDTVPSEQTKRARAGSPADVLRELCEAADELCAAAKKMPALAAGATRAESVWISRVCGAYVSLTVLVTLALIGTGVLAPGWCLGALLLIVAAATLLDGPRPSYWHTDRDRTLPHVPAVVVVGLATASVVLMAFSTWWAALVALVALVALAATAAAALAATGAGDELIDWASSRAAAHDGRR